MTAKLQPFAVAPSLMREWQRTQMALAQAANFEPTLTELVKLRASQINGCANCINLHAPEAREKGESEQRIYLLPAWREAPCYTERERAALAWAEALTHIGPEAAPDELYAEVRRHFSEEEMVKLSLAIAVINSWNRLMIGFRVPPQVAAEKSR